MEQRPLRLGDTVDDYCPRERRLTNHVIVAIVGDSIRQTRCATCDSEHVYKQARVPRRKKKDETGELYDQVLADAGGGQLVQPRTASEVAPPEDAADVEPPAPMAAASDTATDADDARGEETSVEDSQPANELWSGHRRLIRATLPRTADDPPAPRPIPEFTMHQRPPQRGGHGFRHGHGWQGAGGNGNGNGQPRQGGGRHGRPGDFGNGDGNGPGNAQPGQGGRRRRHRGGRNRRPR